MAPEESAGSLPTVQIGEKSDLLETPVTVEEGVEAVRDIA